ncbi:hypothetical protein FXB40_13860 [Bradyrhizobium rifense]|uniref:Uncharacterized protein n=1 Tax=Bradyrhizobium rifense TaxID=515499 RepID=A0A5D3KSI1_9BRAD|nr:hypothetical protein FXB40_13860 [Bradyrhizobium rifense]
MRAQRSNPESSRGGILDCFAALAMTEQGAVFCPTRHETELGGQSESVPPHLSRPRSDGGTARCAFAHPTQLCAPRPPEYARLPSAPCRG